MRHDSRRRLGAFLTVALAVQITGCGTLLYPERKGQRDGRVDTTVALLDGIGLLFFIIPGLIAFLIDFDNGTIYLPGTEGEHRRHRDRSGDGDSRLETPDPDRWIAVHVGTDRLDAKTIRTVVGRSTGKWIDLDDPRLQVTRVATTSNVSGEFAALTR
jgi:hypothetical protein